MRIGGPRLPPRFPAAVLTALDSIPRIKVIRFEHAHQKIYGGIDFLIYVFESRSVKRTAFMRAQKGVPLLH